MVQFLPAVPTFGSQLAEAITGAATNIGQSLLDRSTMQQLQNPNLTPMQKISLIGSLPKEKAAALAQMYGPMLKEESKLGLLRNLISGTSQSSTSPLGQTESATQMAASQEEPQLTEMEGKQQIPSMASFWDKLSPEVKTQIAAAFPQFAEQQENQNYHQKQLALAERKQRLVERKEAKAEGFVPEAKKIEYAGIADRVEKLMKENPWPIRMTPLSEGGAEMRSLGEQMFAAIRDKIVKGNMSQSVFNYIKNSVTVLPGDTNPQIKGKLEAFRRYAKILKEGKDYSNLTIEDAKKMAGKESIKKIGSQTFQVGQTATNPKSGEKLEWTGNEWRKIK